MSSKRHRQDGEFSATDVNKFPTVADFVGKGERDVLAKTGRLGRYVDFLRENGLYTYGRVVDAPNEPEVQVVDERTGARQRMLMFASNNYLGLATHPRVIEAVQKAAAQYGVGVGGSPVICGTSRLHRELEERLAAFEGCEDAMLFPSGYAANLGLISSLVRPGDVSFVDRLVHASVIDGCAFAHGKVMVFRHNDAQSLDAAMSRVDAEDGKLVVIEGVYSMDGDIANVPAIHEVARKHDAHLVIDEAHATGVIGASGHGSVDFWGPSCRPDIIMGTLSKALGSMGGFVAGDEDVISYLRIYGRSQMFSTATTAPQIAAALAALDVLEDEVWRVRQLADNSSYLREQLRQRGIIPVGDGTPIVPVIVGEELTALKVGRMLHERGLFATPILYPAVPRKRARIRLSLMATHERAHIDYLVQQLDEACAHFNVHRYQLGSRVA